MKTQYGHLKGKGTLTTGKRFKKKHQNLNWKKEFSYLGRLERLYHPMLIYGQNRGDIIEAHKFIHSIYDVDCKLSSLLLHNTATRRHKISAASNVPCTTILHNSLLV